MSKSGQPASERLTGRKLGEYELHEVIGQGGMATIYRATQPRVGRDVAVKVVTAPYARYEAFLRRFEQEARTSARLQHPHILPIYDVGVAEGRPYLVMAYLPGGTLHRLIAAHPTGLPLREVIRLTGEIASALDYAHEQGIIHCDLKPGNILLDGQGHAYLSDFGLAQLAEEDGRGRAARPPGTAPYIAPEVLAGDAPGPASDIYALGVIVFQMLTGQHPRQALGEVAAAEEGVAVLPAPSIRRRRPDLPPGVQVVVEQALHHDPAGRPPKALALAKALAHTAGCSSSFRPPAPEFVPPAGEAAEMLEGPSTPPPDVEEGEPPVSAGGPAGEEGASPSDGDHTPPPEPTAAQESTPSFETEEPTPSYEIATTPQRPATRSGGQAMRWLVTVLLVLMLVVWFLLVMISLGQAPPG